MAIKLHRSGGFIFNNVKVDNTNNIYLLDVVKNATPLKVRYDFIIPNRNGSISYFNRYEDNYIDIFIGIYDVNILDRRSKQRNLIKQIINAKADLKFLDEPNLFYKAEIIDAIEETEGDLFTELTIHFKCSWCKYGLKRDINLIADSNKMYNLGNHEADNIIEITAITNCQKVIVSNGINSFTLKNLIAGEKIFVDSEKMIVYKTVDGVKQSVLTRFEGKFLKVPVDTSTFTLAGTNYNATVNIKYNYTYITGR